MTQVTFERVDNTVVELGQVRSDGHDTLVLVIETETIVGAGSDFRFNALHLKGENIYTPMYTGPQSADQIKRDYPSLIDAKEIKILVNEEF